MAPADHIGGLGSAFWWLWSASTASNVADGVVKVAVPLVAVAATRSPALVAGVAVAVTLPWLLLALPVGALVDRWDRRRAMVTANVVRAAGAGLLALALLGDDDAAAIGLLYAAAFVVGSAETVHDIAAQAVVPLVVPPAQLSRGNSRLQAAELAANEFVGPPLGGLLVGVGAALALAVPAATWALAVLALVVLPGTFRARRPPGAGRTTLRAEIDEGLGYLWRHRVLRRLALTTGAFNLASNATFAVLVLWAVGPRSALGLTGTGYGLLFAAIAAGVLVGATLAERVERALGPARAVVVGYLVTVPQFAVLAITDDVALVAVAFVVGGVGLGTWNVIVVSMRQRVTPDHLMGRMSSGYRLVAYGTRPLGAALGGAVAQVLGVRAVFLLACAVVLVGAVGPLRTTDGDLGAGS
ncbi:MFS transporter [uncultured Cellulomonas sp.]|uniref:MFS transporter n=1 Tax=uncultured Cellulomonas sp. TaxID=189682 RepID=UPI00261F1020|nr:MFS transporter [uncultured Cellulomonas sp.]